VATHAVAVEAVLAVLVKMEVLQLLELLGMEQLLLVKVA
jgi:hypothetical protein